MLEQPFPMSSALRARARSLGFLMGYILILTGLPSFDTLMIDAQKSDVARWSASSNALVKLLV